MKGQFLHCRQVAKWNQLVNLKGTLNLVSWNSNIQPENIVADFSKPILIVESVLNYQKITYKE